MGNISFGGLATGMDTASIVDSLVKLERAPASALQTRQKAADKRISILSDLSTKLKALDTAAKAIDKRDELSAFKTTVTGTELTATSSAAAQPGHWTVKVEQLARAETTRSRGFADKAAGAVGAGTLDITVGTADAVSISYGPTDSLDAIAARINDAGASVSASVLFDGTSYRLNVTSKDSGTSSAITFAETGDTLGMTDPGAEVVEARDSKINVAGTTVTRSSNKVSDVIPGITLDLAAQTAAGSDGAVITVERDASKQRELVQKFVDAYNDVAKVLSTQLNYQGEQKGEDTLFGDPTLQSLQRRLGTTFATAMPSGAGSVSARDFGIKLQADGSLKLDATVFDKFTGDHPEKLGHLLAGENDDGGLASSFSTMITEMTKSSTGTLAAKQEGLRSRKRSWDDQIDRINRSADELDTRLRKQFTALEQSVSMMNSNMSYLSSLLY